MVLSHADVLMLTWRLRADRDQLIAGSCGCIITSKGMEDLKRL